MNRAIPLMLVVATLVLSGCASKPPVSVSRDPDVGLAKGEKLAIVLVSHEKCDDGKCEHEPAASAERSLASCLTDSIDGSTVLRAASIRDSAFPRMDLEATPRTMQQWEALLQDADFRRAIEPFNLRYVAFATVTTRAYVTKNDFDTRILVSAFRSTWSTTSTFSVELLDVKSSRRAGNLWSQKTGNGGVVVGLLLIVPVMVIPWWTRTESLTCAAVAAELADFVRRKDAVR